jgi:hypothetical protein
MIYFVQVPPSGLIKIGCTRNAVSLSSRLGVLNSQHRVKLALLGVMEGDVAQERSIHLRFHAFRTRLKGQREWFHPDQSILDFIAANTSLIEPGPPCIVQVRCSAAFYSAIEQLATKDHRRITQMSLMLIEEALTARGLWAPGQPGDQP